MSALADYWREVYEATPNDHPVLRRCKLVRFVSCSNGRGHPPRKPRVVELLRTGGRAYQVTDRPSGELDRIVEQELMVGVRVPPDTTPWEHFLRLVGSEAA